MATLTTERPAATPKSLTAVVENWTDLLDCLRERKTEYGTTDRGHVIALTMT